jgi:hypothetical protein
MERRDMRPLLGSLIQHPTLSEHFRTNEYFIAVA